MNNEKVKEIKKGLECCQGESLKSCEHCPYWNMCKEDDGLTFKSDILTYINELESENKRLLESAKMMVGCFCEQKSLKDRIAELKKENGELKQHVTEVEKGIINIARERNKKEEIASKFIDSYNDSLKQFAERLKEKIKSLDKWYSEEIIDMQYNGITATDIDETLKEFLDEQ